MSAAIVLIVVVTYLIRNVDAFNAIIPFLWNLIRATLMFELDSRHIAYAVGINAQRDIAMARRLIERRIPVDAGELADPAKPLAQMLKAKA